MSFNNIFVSTTFYIMITKFLFLYSSEVYNSCLQDKYYLHSIGLNINITSCSCGLWADGSRCWSALESGVVGREAIRGGRVSEGFVLFYPLVGHAVIASDYRAGGTWFDTRCGQSLYQRWCSLRTLVVDERVNQG